MTSTVLNVAAPARGRFLPQAGTDPRALLRLWYVALAIYLPTMVWLMGYGGDYAVADRLYALQGGQWHWRQHWLTAGWIHQGGKHLSQLMWLGTAIFTASIWQRPAWQSWRRTLITLLASVLISTAIVASIKHALPMACPWDLQRYGGGHFHVGLFERWPLGVPRYHCFPAAHASSGFAWIALYFFCLQVAPRWRGWGLAIGLAMGAVFCASQELRGAHFLSHDLTTIMLCWGTALFLYVGFRDNARA